MLCSFYVVLLKFLAVILHIYRAQGECSISEKEACLLLGKLCSNSQCDRCQNGYIQLNNECYDANYAQNIMLERLEKCNPNNDPECKKKLEGIRDQLADELTKSYHTKEIHSSSLKITKPTTKTINEQKNILSKLKKGAKVNNALVEKDEKADLSKGGDVGTDSLAMLNESETNALSKKSTVDNNSNDDNGDDEEMPDVYFLIIIIACTLSGVAGIALSGYCWYKLHNSDEKVSKNDYIPGVRKTNGKKSPPAKNGDRKLDYKAEMYHYVHTKNQIAAMENAKSDHLSSEGLSHDEEDDVEDYTVYECPGLAPTGDMTVVNPLFSDQEVAGSDEGRTQSNHSSPITPARSHHSPSR